MTVVEKMKLKEDKKNEMEEEDSLGKWFLQFTSVGGLSQLGQSKFMLSKIVWLLLLITGVIVTIVMCLDIYHEYHEYEVSAKTFDIIMVRKYLICDRW